MVLNIRRTAFELCAMEDFPFTYTKMSPEEMEEYWNVKMELEIWKMENGQEQDNFSK